MKIKHIGRRDIKSDYLPHSHENAEVLYITNGEGRVKIRGSVIPLLPGDVVFIPPGLPHTGPGGDCGLIYIIADNPIPEKLQKPFVVQDDERQNIRMFFESIYDVYKRPDNDTAYKNVENSLCELIFELLFSIQLRSEQDADVNALCSAVTRGFRDPDFQLGKEMEKINSSVTYLRRRFHEHMGISPCKYLNSLRIGHAKKLIAKRGENHLSVAGIAYACGFRDERYFTRVFKQYCGMTPGEYYKEVC